MQLFQIILMSRITLLYHSGTFKCGFLLPSLLSSFVGFLIRPFITYISQTESSFSHQESVCRGRRREGVVQRREDDSYINSYPSPLKIELSKAVIGRRIQ